MSGSNIQDVSLAPVPLRERAAAAIREAIFAGRFAPGSEIRQEELAERFAISRMPIREAFQILEREELIERKTHRRAIVRSFTPADIVDHYETRGFIEGELAARAAGRSVAHDDVRAAFEEATYLSREGDPASFGRGSRIFHQAIWAAAGSRRLEKVASDLWTGLPIHLPEIVPGIVPRSKDEHRGICDAVLSGDPERARRALSEHILGSVPAFLQRYNAAEKG
jgi:DNA-binding GntR family transcriptional regulator